MHAVAQTYSTYPLQSVQGSAPEAGAQQTRGARRSRRVFGTVLLLLILAGASWLIITTLPLLTAKIAVAGLVATEMATISIAASTGRWDKKR